MEDKWKMMGYNIRHCITVFITVRNANSIVEVCV